MRSVAITGVGAVSSAGVGMGSLSQAVLGGKTNIGPIARFSTVGFSTHIGATVPGFELRDDIDLCVDYAVIAAREAMAHARVEAPRTRIALVLGSSLGSRRTHMFELTDRIASDLGLDGPRLTVSTACTSSANAVGLARDLLAQGAADVAIAGGADVLFPELYAGFHALGVLGSEPCSPFGLPMGTTLGEGAGFFVLERGDSARARGADILGWVLGYGLSCDAYHPTSPDPSGSGVVRAIRFALADAGIDRSVIDYVNAHGTGTEANDGTEVGAITSALGRRDVPISSSKSFLGHAQGAAGILELLVTLEGMRAHRLPPTMNLHTPRRGGPVDSVPEPREGTFDVALSLNAAFAGANSAVVLGRQPLEGSVPVTRPVVVLGVGAVVGEVAELSVAVRDGHRLSRRAGECRLEALLPMADPRGTDPSTRFVTTACARALTDAHVAMKGDLRDRVGIVAAASSFSAESGNEFQQSIVDRGLQRLSAPAFAKLVLSSPIGAAARMLALRGPTSTITTGRGGGLVAMAYAAMLLVAGGKGVDHMIGVALDEVGHDDDRADAAEGAGALLFGHDSSPGTRLPRLVAWIIGAPGNIDDVVATALGNRRSIDVDLVLTDGADVELRGFERVIDVTRAWGHAPSASGGVACVVATDMIRRDWARRVLVVTPGGGASVALLFEGGSVGT